MGQIGPNCAQIGPNGPPFDPQARALSYGQGTSANPPSSRTTRQSALTAPCGRTSDAFPRSPAQVALRASSASRRQQPERPPHLLRPREQQQCEDQACASPHLLFGAFNGVSTDCPTALSSSATAPCSHPPALFFTLHTVTVAALHRDALNATFSMHLALTDTASPSLLILNCLHPNLQPNAAFISSAILCVCVAF